MLTFPPFFTWRYHRLNQIGWNSKLFQFRFASIKIYTFKRKKNCHTQVKIASVNMHNIQIHKKWWTTTIWLTYTNISIIQWSLSFLLSNSHCCFVLLANGQVWLSPKSGYNWSIRYTAIDELSSFFLFDLFYQFWFNHYSR